MSVTYQKGVDYLKSYPGVLKILEAGLHTSLIVLTIALGASIQPQFLCGVSIYGLVSAVVLFAFHIRGIIKNFDFPWLWVECINSAILAVLILVSSSIVLAVLTKMFIITGIIGLVVVLVYTLDAIEEYNLARTPRARYVWTTPNMPE